jgi:hypothetical protein
MINIFLPRERQSGLASVAFLFTGLVLSNTCLADASNQSETGTFYKVVHEQKYIVGAVDSRLTHTGDSAASDTCKVEILGDHAFFLAQGIVKQTDADGHASFDAYAVAKRAYDSSAASDITTRAAAAKFAATANEAFARDYQGGPDRIYVVGIFAESLPDGSLNLDFATVYSKKGALERLVAGAAPPEGKEASAYQPAGFSEIAKEAKERTSERSKALYDRLSEKLSHATNVDQDALAADDTVQAVEDWGNNKTVGGDVATVILESGKPVRWYTKPSNCN